MIREQYYLDKDPARIQFFLDTFKTEKDVTASNLQKMLSNTPKRDDNGKIIGVNPPKYYTSDEFLLPANTLANQPKEIQTNYGLYLFNLKCIANVFGKIVPYVEQHLDDRNLGNLLQSIAKLLTEDKITGKQFAQFQDNYYFLSYKATLYLPGTNTNVIRPNPKVTKYRDDLIKEHQALLDPNRTDYVEQYINLIEKPTLKYAKEILKDDPAFFMYKRGGKPKFDNVYKNIAVGVGPIYDPVSDKFVIHDKSFNEGLPNDMTNTYANILVGASHSRAIATADGGTMVKYIFSAMQTVVFDDRQSDCKTQLYDERLITEDDYKNENIMYRYIMENGKPIMLSPENFKSYIGKKVKMRSPLYCKGARYCNICSGDYLFELGLVNVGNTATKIGSTLMNKALKAMHDISLTTSDINIFNYLDK